MSINDDIHKIEPGELVDLYVLDLNNIGQAIVYYFYPGLDENSQNIKFQGQIYTPFPMMIEGLQKRGTGAERRPKVTISNHLGLISALMSNHEDLVGATVERRRTLGKYLGTDIPDISTYTKELYFVEQKTNETPLVVQLDLASAMDFMDKRLPARTAVANSCPWQYKSTDSGSGCGWPGVDSSKWFDKSGAQVFTEQEDSCGKRLKDCKLRFGNSEPLDFGGFPSLGRV